MKHLFLISLVFLISTFVKAQPDGSQVFSVENFPELKCGYEQYYSFKTAADDEGSFYASGLFEVNGEYNRHIIRVNKERKAVAFLEVDFVLYNMTVQEDGKLLIGYNETDENGERKGRIRRYNKDLTIDPSFVSPVLDLIFVLNDAGVIKQKDDAIFVGGHVLAEEQGHYSYLYKLDMNGAIDLSFNKSLAQFPFTSNYIYYRVYDILFQEDGKLLVANKGLGVNNSAELIRLNSDGSFDNSFVQNADGGKIYRMSRTQDGKIILVGNFTSYNSEQAHKIARINLDGTLDNSFDSGTGFGTNYSEYLYNVSSFPKGRIVCQGRVSSYNGSRIRNMVILEDNGQIWNQFTWDSSFDDMQSVYSVEKIDDYQVAVLSLTSINNIKVSILSDDSVLSDPVFEYHKRASAYFNEDQLVISFPEPVPFQILNITGKVYRKGSDRKKTIVNTALWPTGIYIITTAKGENLRVLKK